MKTTRDERAKWRVGCLESGTPYVLNECDLIRLLDDPDEPAEDGREARKQRHGLVSRLTRPAVWINKQTKGVQR